MRIVCSLVSVTVIFQLELFIILNVNYRNVCSSNRPQLRVLPGSSISAPWRVDFRNWQVDYWFNDNNGFVLEDRSVSCQIPFSCRIYGNGRSDNRLRRFCHLVGHTIFFLPRRCESGRVTITRADFVQANVFRSRSMNTPTVVRCLCNLPNVTLTYSS